MKKRLLSSLRSVRGFTMIELLVVIAIIGVLAVAVLSAINPIEQINKGRDTRTRSDAAELLSAIERFFTTQEQYPWNSTVDVADAEDPYPGWTAIAQSTDAFDTNSATGFGWLQTLQDSNEIKPAFGQRIFNNYEGETVAVGDNRFVVLKADLSDEVRVCFVPTSKQFRSEAIRKCCAADSTSPACIEPAAASLKGSTPESIVGSNGAFDLCPTIDGSSADADVFYLCLP